MRKVCIFTSTRAEWGLMQRLATLIKHSPILELQILASGTHLSEKFGATVCEIEQAGFSVNEKVDILKFDDTKLGNCRTMGLAMSAFAEALERLSPDLVIILGDRYESFCMAAAALVLCVPIAHIHGGEVTEGALDEAFRHSITKMSHIHFSTSEVYSNRILQLGEHPDFVFNVGALGIENIRKQRLMSRRQLEDSIKFKLDTPFFLVTYHPVTLESNTTTAQLEQLFEAIDHFQNIKVVFTKSNADANGETINRMIDAHVAKNPNRCLAVTSLGTERYLSAISLCEAVVGNSSSGILEAPLYNVPTINIGDRQKGRIRVKSIIDCAANAEAIVNAIKFAFSKSFRESIKNLKHPSEQVDTAQKIVRYIETTELSRIIKKAFRDI